MEWQTILAIAKNNGYPIKTIDNLGKKLLARKQKQQQDQHQETTELRKKWVTFTHYSPLIRRITNLFKQTELKIAFKATNTIQQQITEKQALSNPSRVYKLKCNTCNMVYVGQSGRAISTWYKEYIRYIKSNNSTSAYAAHILQNGHEFGTEKNTMQLIKACQKSLRMDCWEALYMYAYREQQVLIEEQQVNDTNAIFEMANIQPPHDIAQ